MALADTIERVKDIKNVFPTDGHVLVRVDSVEKITKGGIILATQTHDQEKFAETQGQLMFIGPWAKTEISVKNEKGEWKEWVLPTGDVEDYNLRCQFARYAGQKYVQKGKPKVLYKIMNAGDLISIIMESKEA